MMYLSIYLIVVNLAAFSMYGIDKQKAIRHQWRISEAALIGVAVLGGGIGAFLGMRIFRHKTKHVKFVLGVPVCILLWAAGIAYIIMK
ncbi:MAG: DUF1294 domain-containing protein [Lachnospiraceae bacterium]|nr:DUF1294 domain-containing protein [Lachnospiraceae bacterium]